METFLQLVYGVVGIALLYYGAEYLIRGGVSIANRLRIPPLVIGLTLVAFGTSAPELCVSVDAALKGSGDISVGNVVGSNICNIALILGLSALIATLNVNRKLLRLDMPVMMASALALCVCCLAWGGVGRWQALTLLGGLVLYLGWCLYAGRRDGASGEEDESLSVRYTVPVALLCVVGGLGGLVLGAKLFVGCAVHIARLLSVSEAVIGLTVVAVGTSLPELATSVVAALRGEKDIAVGNVVGSNIFNVMCILGIAPLISPISSPGIGLVDLGLMAGLSVLLYPMMRRDLVIGRLEGAALVLVYVAYLAWLVWISVTCLSPE